MLTTDNCLGIYITQAKAEFVLLKPSRGKLKVARAGSCEIPAGVISRGMVKDPAALGRCLRGMLAKNRIRCKEAVVSMPPEACLTQILEMPSRPPANPASYIQGEIRHSAMLGGKSPCLDYRPIENMAENAAPRIVAAAADMEKVNSLIKALNAARIEPVSIEPPQFAAFRALYREITPLQNEKRSILIDLEKTGMTLSVFNRKGIDFIRQVVFSDSDLESGAGKRILLEIHTILQYYQLQDTTGIDPQWHISLLDQHNMLDETFRVDEEIETAKLDNGSINLLKKIVVDPKIKAASLTAAGLALKQAHTVAMKINMDLVPKEQRKIRNRKRQLLINANVAAVTLLIAFLLAGLTGFEMKKRQAVMDRSELELSANMLKMQINRSRGLENDLAKLRNKTESITSILNTSRDASIWTKLLNEISAVIPENVCITDVRSIGAETISIQGYAENHQKIYDYLDAIKASPMTENTEIIETSASDYADYINYLIEFKLAVRKNNLKDV